MGYIVNVYVAFTTKSVLLTRKSSYLCSCKQFEDRLHSAKSKLYALVCAIFATYL